MFGLLPATSSTTRLFLPGLIVSAFSSLAMLALAGAAGAATIQFSCGGQDNIDIGSGGVDVACTAPIAVTGDIVDIDVILDINNNSGGATYASDLEITLTHVESGTSVVLYRGSAPAAPTSIIYSVFDDESPNGLAPTSGDVGGPQGVTLGSFQPVDPLNVFDMLPVDGVGGWILTIEDISQWPNEGHDLVDWSMVVTTVPEPGTGVLVGIGLVGLATLGGPAPLRAGGRRR